MKMMKTFIGFCSLAAVFLLGACATTSHDQSSNNGNTEVYGTAKAGIEGSSTH